MANTRVMQGQRLEHVCQVRLPAAVFSGGAAGLIMLAGYYATLSLLPTATAWPTTDAPVSAWAHRFDLSQFLGTIPFPPRPTLFTWWAGLGIWWATLAGCGVAYAILLSWTLQQSDALKGAGLGIGLCLTLLFGLTLAQGFHPAVMRNALPDTGVLMTGWSVWGAIQLVALYILYGAILGILYRRRALR